MSVVVEEHKSDGGRVGLAETEGGPMMAYVEYAREEHGDQVVLDAWHTLTDPKFRGQGLAEKATQGFCEYVQRQGFKMIPSCSYIATKFLPKHPELQELIFMIKKL